MPEEQVYSVSAITNVIKTQLEMQFPHIMVSGEISNFRPAASGHLYFAIKDANSSLSVVMFRSRQGRVPFRPKDGDKVIITGGISVYQARGAYQLIAESMRYAGEGDILALLEERKRKYAALGYFDPAIKKELPPFPKTIGVVTSETGAALRDILNVLERRNRGAKVVIFPSLVQGEQAADMIASRIDQASRMEGLDVLLVSRGGGSIEDLLPFSESCVIEAIHRCTLPVISAVGHEIDHALSDYVADLRAPTPSAAAEVVSTSYATILERLSAARREIALTMNYRVHRARSVMQLNSSQMMKERVLSRLREYSQRSDDLYAGYSQVIHQKLRDRKQELKTWNEKLHALSPLSILSRGYAIVTKVGDSVPLTHAGAIRKDERLHVRLHSGSIDVEAKEIMEKG